MNRIAMRFTQHVLRRVVDGGRGFTAWRTIRASNDACKKAVRPAVAVYLLAASLAAGQIPLSEMFFNAVACTAIYGGIFAAQAEVRRLRQTEKPPGRSILPSIRKGGYYGALFFGLAIGPAILAQFLIAGRVFEQLAWLQKAWSPQNVFHFLWTLGGSLLEFAMVAGFLAFFGFFLGAAGGTVAGAVIEARKQ